MKTLVFSLLLSITSFCYADGQKYETCHCRDSCRCSGKQSKGDLPCKCHPSNHVKLNSEVIVAKQPIIQYTEEVAVIPRVVVNTTKQLPVVRNYTYHESYSSSYANGNCSNNSNGSGNCSNNSNGSGNKLMIRRPIRRWIRNYN